MTPVSTPVEAVPDEVRAAINEAWDNLLNKDDRTSPEDYPDHALIAFEELAEYMRMVADRASRPASPPRADAREAHTPDCRFWDARPMGTPVCTCRPSGEPCEACEGTGALETGIGCPSCNDIGTVYPATQPAEAVRASQEERSDWTNGYNHGFVEGARQAHRDQRGGDEV